MQKEHDLRLISSAFDSLSRLAKRPGWMLKSVYQRRYFGGSGWGLSMTFDPRLVFRDRKTLGGSGWGLSMTLEAEFWALKTLDAAFESVGTRLAKPIAAIVSVARANARIFPSSNWT